MAKDLRSENDNLKEWRLKKSQLTEELLRKSLDELLKLNAIINQKTVCDMMYKLASEEDKQYNAIISPSAISKNEVYKNMISETKQKLRNYDNKKQNYKTDGDKQLEIFQLKTIIAKKEVKIKELEAIIQRANFQQNNVSLSVQKTDIDYKIILKELINFVTQEAGIAYYDDKQNLIDEATGNILILSTVMKGL